MAHVKNVGGGPSDEDPRPLPRHATDADTARAAVVAEVIERAERGGARSGVVIVDQLSPSTRAALEQVEHRHGGLARTLMVGGRRVTIDESQPQGES